MPLGKTETMSSMAGPRQVTNYDDASANMLKRLIVGADMEINQVMRDKNIPEADKYGRIEELKDLKEYRKDRFNQYINDAKFRDKYRNSLFKDQQTFIAPEWDAILETETRTNPSRILDLEKPKVISKSMMAEDAGINSVSFGEDSPNLATAPKNRSEFLATQPGPTGASVRTKNFVANNAQSMEDFMKLTEDQVRQARNVGASNWDEIKTIQDKIKKDPKSWGFYRKELDIPELEYSATKKLNPPAVPEKAGRMSGIAKGLGKAVLRGAAEAPALEFLNPPSAGPSDPEDPVFLFERGLISESEFKRLMRK